MQGERRLTERETTRLCPDCEEEYLIEVREPGVRAPIEIYCPSCGYTEDNESDDEDLDGEEEAKSDDDLDDIADIDDVSHDDEDHEAY